MHHLTHHIRNEVIRYSHFPWAPQPIWQTGAASFIPLLLKEAADIFSRGFPICRGEILLILNKNKVKITNVYIKTILYYMNFTIIFSISCLEINSKPIAFCCVWRTPLMFLQPHTFPVSYTELPSSSELSSLSDCKPPGKALTHQISVSITNSTTASYIIINVFTSWMCLKDIVEIFFTY